MATHNIVVIVGSLRKESFTLKIANALAKLAPDTLKLDVTTLHDISFFNQDLEANPPADWLAFREKLQKSAGVIIVTPEYNRSIPGVLKNAIDVASRPYGKSSFNGQPMGIVSNSPGPLGGVSAAKHLQNILPGISGPILQQPEIYLNGVGDAFDDMAHRRGHRGGLRPEVPVEFEPRRMLARGRDHQEFQPGPGLPGIAGACRRRLDKCESNAWAGLAGLFCATQSAFLDHERAKSELKALMPEDAKEASGHGVRAKRSKSGAVSFDLLARGGAPCGGANLVILWHRGGPRLRDSARRFHRGPRAVAKPDARAFCRRRAGSILRLR